MNYYVFRVNYDGFHSLIRQELLKGRLRQGWGADGMEAAADDGWEAYRDAWRRKWPDDRSDDARICRKYRNLQMMRDMKPGDAVIIPKMDLEREYGWDRFTIALCSGTYRFSPLCGDFGHIIPVEPLVSYSYGRNEDTLSIKGSFRWYQSAVNRILREDLQAATTRLIEGYRADPGIARGEDLSPLEALSSAAAEAKRQYLAELVKKINGWSPNQLERVIEDLFTRCGYIKTGSNHYDRQGGDIDLKFTCCTADTLLGDIAAMSEDVALPEIRVQAKKKSGPDRDDVRGVRQLIRMDGRQSAINILISTAPAFSEEARREAGGAVILIDGQRFAALLVKYGLDALDQIAYSGN